MEATYERSYCVQALLDAGLPAEPPNTLAMLSRTMEVAEQAMRTHVLNLALSSQYVVVDGKMLRQLRNDRRWNGMQLAVRAGVSTATIYNTENGRWATTLYITAKAIADALGVDLEDILADDLADVA